MYILTHIHIKILWHLQQLFSVFKIFVPVLNFNRISQITIIITIIVHKIRKSFRIFMFKLLNLFFFSITHLLLQNLMYLFKKLIFLRKFAMFAFLGLFAVLHCIFRRLSGKFIAIKTIFFCPRNIINFFAIFGKQRLHLRYRVQASSNSFFLNLI